MWNFHGSSGELFVFCTHGTIFFTTSAFVFSEYCKMFFSGIMKITYFLFRCNLIFLANIGASSAFVPQVNVVQCCVMTNLWFPLLLSDFCRIFIGGRAFRSSLFLQRPVCWTNGPKGQVVVPKFAPTICDLGSKKPTTNHLNWFIWISPSHCPRLPLWSLLLGSHHHRGEAHAVP